MSPGSAGPQRLLCDRMLERLCRWLRAAGHDVRLAGDGEPDSALIAAARAGGRTLVTRDRALAAGAGTLPVVVLSEHRPVGQAAQLGRALAIDWLAAPFSRCLLCNAPLEPAPAEAAPAGAGGSVRRCPCCRRAYWAGSHVRRLDERLRRLQATCIPEANDLR